MKFHPCLCMHKELTMTILSNLAADKNIFHATIPPRPSGKYVHFVLLRETESFPLFQTDGSLNVIRVRSGIEATNNDIMTRLILFKRKQSSPERLTGRELLRSLILSAMIRTTRSATA